MVFFRSISYIVSFIFFSPKDGLLQVCFSPCLALSLFSYRWSFTVSSFTFFCLNWIFINSSFVCLWEVLLGRFLFQLFSEIIILHAPKFCHLVHWFQNCFCFCCTTFPSHVGWVLLVSAFEFYIVTPIMGMSHQIWFGGNFWLGVDLT